MTKLFNAANIRARTAEFAQKFAPRANRADTSLAQRCADIIAEGDMGCQEATAKKLVAALVGVDTLPAPTSSSTPEGSIPFVVGSLIHFNDGGSPATTVLINMIDDDGDAHFLTATGSNSLPNGDGYIHRNADRDHIRIPTAPQIRRFLRTAGISD